MKNDNYLRLCLEQASRSPMHFRHGCIVVKGGKVIGQGFNDYRPGFDGGVLKTGRMPLSAFPLDDSAVAAYKHNKRHAKKGQPQHSQQAQQSLRTLGTFTPFERRDGTSNANGKGAGAVVGMSLTMHSEMMAINSALASSGTLASSTVSRVKPSAKLSSGSLKPRRALKSSAVDSSLEYNNNDDKNHNNNGAKSSGGLLGSQPPRNLHKIPARLRLPTSGALYPVHLDSTRTPNSVFHAAQEKRARVHQHQHQHHKTHGYGRQFYTKQQHRHFGQRSSSESYELPPPQSNHSTMTSNQRKQAPINNNHVVPVGRPSLARKTTDRFKYPKLVGADVYVARLANNGLPKPKRASPADETLSEATVTMPGPAADPCASSAASSLFLTTPLLSPALSPTLSTTSSCSSPPSLPFPTLPPAICVSAQATGSLHDELICCKEAPPSPPTAPNEDGPDPGCPSQGCMSAIESRPCYRCVAYMHSVGIKRVFWTNSDGKWEGAKVRSLVDMMDGCADADTVADLGVYVTKHEVLMLRRMMGHS